jgi:hypothetical protein
MHGPLLMTSGAVRHTITAVRRKGLKHSDFIMLISPLLTAGCIPD